MEKFCSKCGNEFKEGDIFCSKCGANPDDNTIQQNAPVDTNVTTFVCPKCHNSNVMVQIVNESQLVTKHHGFLWWLCIGWWWVPFKWLVLTIPALIFAIFVGKRKKIKNISKKVKVCQNCGHTW